MSTIYESAVRLTEPFQSLSLFPALVCSTIVCALWLALAVILNTTGTKAQMKGKEPHPAAKALLYMSVIMTFLFMLFSVCFASIWITGKMHGMYDSSLPIKTVTYHIAHTPVESKLPQGDIPDDSLILYYRFGCPDCSATFEELNNAFGTYPNVYWVSSRSKQGKALMKQYPIEKVPAGVYVRDKDHVTTRILYKNDKDNNTKVNQSAVRLFLKYLSHPLDEETETDYHGRKKD